MPMGFSVVADQVLPKFEKARTPNSPFILGLFGVRVQFELGDAPLGSLRRIVLNYQRG